MKEINPYLSFNGNCREAMKFYQQCLGVELEIAAFPDAQGKPSTDPDAKVMHSSLMREKSPILMASDTRPDDPLQMGNNISISIQLESVEEIERIFASLAQGGKVTMPPTDAPWGARFGMLTDRFGIHWLLNCQLHQ